MGLRVLHFVDTTAEVPAGRFRIEPTGPKDLTLRPRLITATGRSGTTLLMRRLGNARQIVIADLYTFATKLLTYYGDALELPTTASSRLLPSRRRTAFPVIDLRVLPTTKAIVPPFRPGKIRMGPVPGAPIRAAPPLSPPAPADAACARPTA